jgi:nicotinamidase-related amidase
MQCALPPDWTDAVKRHFVEISRQEWVFYKPRWSAFFKTPLADHLAAHGLDTLVVAGCNFPNCPSATIFDATERDLRVVLAIDAVSMTGPDTRTWCRGLGVLPMPATEIDSNLSSSP